MPFDDKLRLLADRTESANRIALGQHTRHLAKLVANVLREDKWANLPAQVDKALTDVAGEASECARYLDAVGYLEEKVFTPASGKVIDLILRGDLRDVQEQILEMFESKQAPERGFVYVAWSHRPEEYWYVGMARTVERLNLSAHGKLSGATAQGHAKRLSLIFPSQSREEILSGVEASILALIEFNTESLPRYNDRRETVPLHRGAGDLDNLSGFLGRIARMLQASI